MIYIQRGSESCFFQNIPLSLSVFWFSLPLGFQNPMALSTLGTIARPFLPSSSSFSPNLHHSLSHSSFSSPSFCRRNASVSFSRRSDATVVAMAKICEPNKVCRFFSGYGNMFVSVLDIKGVFGWKFICRSRRRLIGFYSASKNCLRYCCRSLLLNSYNLFFQDFDKALSILRIQ